MCFSFAEGKGQGHHFWGGGGGCFQSIWRKNYYIAHALDYPDMDSSLLRLANHRKNKGNQRENLKKGDISFSYFCCFDELGS